MRPFLLLPAILFTVLLIATPAALPAADYKPDDSIAVTLATEGWVSTKTARVTVQVSAAVSGDNAGATRDAMIKAVSALGGGDWRLVTFNRNPSDTGLENWYAQFENRLPESDLGGMNDKVKKASKPGMQLTVAGIDFTPTLAETQAAEAGLRKTLMEMANAELKAVQAAFPDRGYRIAAINFNGAMPIAAPQPMNARGGMMKTMAAPAMDAAESGDGVETAQKLHVNALVVFSAIAPVAAPASAGSK